MSFNYFTSNIILLRVKLTDDVDVPVLERLQRDNLGCSANDKFRVNNKDSWRYRMSTYTIEVEYLLLG